MEEYDEYNGIPRGVDLTAEVAALDRMIGRDDGSYVILRNGNPYHVPNDAEFAELWTLLQARAQAEPEIVLAEEPEPEPEITIADALKHLRAKRKAVEYGGFVFQGQRWDSEEKDELRLNSMITMMGAIGLTSFEGWKINADTYITLTPELALQAAAAMMQHYHACFALENAKATEINALATSDALRAWLAASLDTGWPTL